MKSVFSFHGTTAVPLAKTANRLQLVVALVIFVSAVTCLYLATRYYQFAKIGPLSHQGFVSAVMDNAQPTKRPNDHIVQLHALHQALPRDGSISLALAKAYSLKGLGTKAGLESGALAMQYVMQAEDAQPTHYEAFAVKMAITEMFTSHKPLDINSLENGLVLAPFEWETQSIVGPVLIAHWYELPSSIKQKAKPVIRGALRQKPTRERLIATMENTRIVAPFVGLSPGKWITKRLQRIEQTVTNTDV
ncbi:hypothetical protein [Alteromonas sp. C1M14]|uniref:hypothetical protein n=1 Tax=Alteromonas sp. C1M14 TaxID=2841567 RepID=UPI001C083F40|nr:hypothetical protein [Alteromonas sp. C1M14]MBU2977712.1 hypothetical protein [Alteromonas sp. C1M14]